MLFKRPTRFGLRNSCLDNCRHTMRASDRPHGLRAEKGQVRKSQFAFQIREFLTSLHSRSECNQYANLPALEMERG